MILLELFNLIFNRIKGLFILVDWISQCLEYLQIQGPLNLLNIDESSQKVFDVFLECGNLNECCEAPLIPILSVLDELHGQPFNGSKPIILQINEIFNAGAPFSTRKNTNSARLLKLQMTDGYSNITGIELEAINGINKLSPPGIKICIFGAIVYHGTLLLTNRHCKVLGGGVPEYDRYAANDETTTDVSVNQSSSVPVLPSSTAIPATAGVDAEKIQMDMAITKPINTEFNDTVSQQVEIGNLRVVKEDRVDYEDVMNGMDDYSYYDKYAEEEMLLDTYDEMPPSIDRNVSKPSISDKLSDTVYNQQQNHVISVYDDNNVKLNDNISVATPEIECDFHNHMPSVIIDEQPPGHEIAMTEYSVDLNSENHQQHHDYVVDHIERNSVVDMTNDSGEINMTTSTSDLKIIKQIFLTNFRSLINTLSTDNLTSEGWIRGLAVGITIFSVVDNPMDSKL